ncbi:hypothetical protein C8R46DRAFT_1189514 [Mycena filopes]|nr:hypothetical protein C8R46DRAFT_1189514 [Mycena filopes]
MQLTPYLLALVLSATSAYAQDPCGNIPATIATEAAQMTAFNNKVPPPSVPADCAAAKKLKASIDAFRTQQILNVANGCAGEYGSAILANGQFNPAFTKFGKFVGTCP